MKPSPQSRPPQPPQPKRGKKPAKRAKARLMWCDLGEVERANHGPLTPNRRYCTQSPVHVLDASPEAHELRVEEGAKAMYINERRHESMKMTWETTWAAVRAAYRKDARAVLATVYDPPVGKGRGNP